MKQRYFFSLTLALVTLFLIILCNPIYAQVAVDYREAPNEAFTHRFTENKGQWPSFVKYRVLLPGGALFLEENRLSYAFLKEDALPKHPQHHDEQPHNPPTIPGHIYRTEFIGANQALNPLPIAASESYDNFFLGKRQANNVRSFRSVWYKQLYNGIDLELTSAANGSLKYNYYVAANTNPSQIKLAYPGVTALDLTPDGKLIIKTSVNTLEENTPFAYQLVDGIQKPVSCRYLLAADKTVQFALGTDYNPSLPLVIDPELIFCTYTGAFADNWGFTATYDNEGNFYTGGIVHIVNPTESFPVSSGAVQVNYGGGENVLYVDPNTSETTYHPDSSLYYGSDMALMKYSPDGRRRIWGTYLGGMKNDQPHSLITNATRQLYLMGTTRSPNFPVSPGAFDPTFNGYVDIVVCRISEDGRQLLGSTFIGGRSDDGINAKRERRANPLRYFYADDARGEIVLDDNDNPVIVSSTQSDNFPTTNGAAQRRFGGIQDACVFKLSQNLNQLLWSSYYGGSNYDAGYSVKLDAAQNPIIVGGTTSSNLLGVNNGFQSSYQGGSADGFIIRFSANGSTLLNGTYLGTSRYDQIQKIDLNSEGDVYVVGQTEGFFPIENARYGTRGGNQFINRFNKELNRRTLSTTFGAGTGLPDITINAFLVDICDNIYVSGWGGSALGKRNIGDLPVTNDAIKRFSDGNDFYLIAIKAQAEALMYATFFGGTESADHVDGGTSRFDKAGVVYQSICGSCFVGTDIATTPNAWSRTDNSPRQRCNNASFKLKFGLVDAAFANFSQRVDTAAAIAGCEPFRVVFTNKSEGAQQYIWSFGDGNTSTQANPAHIYQNPGTYTVKLEAINNGKCNKSDVTLQRVTVYANAVPGFNVQTTPCSNNVTITDQSVKGTTFYWDFGFLGGFSSRQNPGEVRFPGPGSYTITQIINPESRLCNKSLSRTINIPSGPTAAFTVGNVSCRPQVRFTNNSKDATTFLWDFGNGQTSTEREPTVNFRPIGTYNVLLRAIAGVNCTDETTQNITFPQKQVADFTPELTPCDPTVKFTNTSKPTPIAVEWRFGTTSGGTSTQINPTFVYPEEGGTFNVRLITQAPQDGCGDTVTKPVRIEPIPKAEFLFRRIPCTRSLVLTNQSLRAQTYLWNMGDGKAPQTFQNATYTSDVPGQYTVKLDAINGDCKATVSQVVQVSAKPTAAFTVQIDTCRRSVNFTNLSRAANRYRWRFGDPANSNSITTNPQFTYPDSGRFRVELFAFEPVDDCADTSRLTLNFPPLPLANFSINRTPCLPTIRFRNLSRFAKSYEWTFGNNPTLFTKTSDSTYTFTQPGNYTIRLRAKNDPCFNEKTEQVRISIQPKADFDIINQECSRKVVINNKSLNGTSFLWDFGDGTTSTSASPVHTYDVSGKYKVKLLVDCLGECTDTISKIVLVGLTPTARIRYRQADPCRRNVHIFSASSNTLTQVWTLSDGTTKTDSAFNHTFQTFGKYVVKLVATASNNCTDTKIDTIHVRQPAKAAFTVSQRPCTRSITLTSTSQRADSLRWILPNGSQFTAPTLQYTFDTVGVLSIKLIANPGNSCADTLVSTVNIPQIPIPNFDVTHTPCTNFATMVNKTRFGNIYAWETNDGQSSTQPNPTFKFRNSATYRIKLVARSTQQPDCPVEITRAVTIVAPTVAHINLEPILCDSTRFLTDSSVNAVEYRWILPNGKILNQRNPRYRFEQPGTYTLKLITNPNGPCPDTASKQILIKPIPKAALTVSIPHCSRQIFLNSDNFQTGDFIIDFGDGNKLADSTTSYTYKKAGDYWVKLIVQPDSQCRGIDSQLIKLRNVVRGDFSVNLFGCERLISINNGLKNATTYLWDFGDGTTSSLPAPKHTYKQPGTYTIKVVAEAGTICETTREQTISLVEPNPVNISTNRLRCSSTIELSSGIKDGLAYLWTFPNMTTSFQTEANPLVSFPTKGRHLIKVEVLNPNGCISSDSTTIDYDPDPLSELLIPNVFSPNQDGINELFEVVGRSADCIERVEIYDRWGNTMFVTDDFRKSWDGRYNGNLVPEGVYVYLFKVQGMIRTGTVTVLR